MIESKKNKQPLNTVLGEIKYLRRMQDFVIDHRNSNRYRIIVKEKLGHTAYCFSTPIYNTDTRKLIHLYFDKTKSGYTFKGSNGTISVCQNRCIFENREGRVVVSLKDLPIIYGFKGNTQSTISVSPTLNGLRFIITGKSLSFLLRSETKQESIRFHSTCFSIMREQFKPFLSVSALYASDGKGTYAPVEMKYRDIDSGTYELECFHEVQNGRFMFEINLYESKLFQDTTVESIHPDENNAYGAIGFIGKTVQFGEQWLYSRPDFSKISDFTSERIDKVLLHIPVLNGSSENVDVYIPGKRFCSFGSTWNQKVNASGKVTSSNNNGRYITIDVTTMFTNRTEHTLVYNEGLILEKTKDKNNFIAISTGDCYSAPQILEIKFKNKKELEITQKSRKPLKSFFNQDRVCLG